MVSQGRIERERDVKLEVVLPAAALSGKIYLQQAINNCYQKGARACEHQDLAFACSNRASLNINFPDQTWLYTGSTMVRSLGTSSRFIGYTVYRRFGTRCFGPNTVNPSDGSIS